MSTTYDPKDPKYLDEADVREELTRVFDLCHGCRLCFKFCSAFPTLFEMIDKFDDQDAGRLTPAEQNQVVDECFNCKLCYVNCPYIPSLHEWALDFPRLMLRAEAMLHETHQQPLAHRATTQVIARTDLVGKLATATAPVANAIAAAPPESAIRKVMSKVVGISDKRVIEPYAKQRFSTWFKKRTAAVRGTVRRRAVVYPTCLVEYTAVDIGKDLVSVYERNGIDCSVSSAGCCGAPWLHSGNIEHFTKVARENVATLAEEVRNGRDIVVPSPTCSYVLKQDYVDYVGGPDADLVAAHTFDTAEYLVDLHKSDDQGGLDTEFAGETPATVTYHAPCHLRAQNIGFKSRDLMKLTGAKVKVIQQCSGIDGFWGMRADTEQWSLPISAKLGDEITRAGGEVVVGDCNLANTAIEGATEDKPLHTMTFMARAYGIAASDPK